MTGEIVLDQGRMTVELQVSSDVATYLLVGEIDERFDHKKIRKENKPIVKVVLAKVKSINSSGVREWVFWMRDLADVPTLLLEECSVPFLDQINIVPQMLGKAQVTSFYAPYYCPNCDQEDTCLIDTKKHKSVLMQKRAPEMTHHCGQIMEFDALEDSYFHQVERFF
jgi:hypothetical protein